MKERTWKKGPPPHVGWWNTRAYGLRSDRLWGWWDGKGWSTFADEDCLEKAASNRANERGAIYDGLGIEWSDHWPKNARVPRTNPEAK